MCDAREHSISHLLSDALHPTSDISHACPRAWFAIRTKPRQETVARDQLRNQAFEVYLPLVNTRITHARKVNWQPRPFFSGYLFMHLSQEERCWTTIRSTIGVLAAVSFGDFYPPVPDAAINMLQSRHDEHGYVSIDETPEAPFKAGEKVNMLDGSLKGLEAVFIEMRGEDRAVILLDWMHKKMRVETRTNNLAIVK